MVNIDFDEPKQTNNSKHISLSFKIFSLNDLLDSSINLIDDSEKPLEFNSGETKISILNFKMDLFLKWTKN